jgi:septal ring factor EnvC (AmiA/AmiB activator)
VRWVDSALTATFFVQGVYFDQTAVITPKQGATPMNRFILSTSLALALSGTLVFAQQSGASAASTTTKTHHHARNPQREAAHLSKKLNLSSDQTAKLEPILADRDQKIAALKSDPTITPMTAQKQMHAIHQQTRQLLATILTPDQIQQLKSRHHSHGIPAQTPQTNPQAGL